MHDYLTTIHYLIRFTRPCLRRALARSAEDVQLRAIFAAKLSEEQGHEAWVLSDIQHLRRRFELSEPGRVLPGAEKLAGAFNEALERDPLAYLVYAVLTEYLTARLGMPTVQALHEQCGIPREALTVLQRHVELDVAHADEGFQVLGALDLEVARRQYAEGHLHRYFGHYREVFDALADVAQRPERRPLAGSSRLSEAAR